jgi:hypothetical protein
MQSQARHGITRREQAARGGSDVPQGTDVDQAWVDVFQRRGRRSPLVSRPEGRPSENAERGRFCWPNCDRVGTPWGVWEGTSSKLNVVPSLSPLATRVSMRTTENSSRNGVEPTRRRTIGREDRLGGSVAHGWSTSCATALLLGIECPARTVFERQSRRAQHPVSGDQWRASGALASVSGARQARSFEQMPPSLGLGAERAGCVVQHPGRW